MKILLFALNASRTHTNLAVRSLYRCLRGSGLEAIIIESHTKEKSSIVFKKLIDCGADVFGFSVYLWNRSDMLRYARALKTLCPTAFVFFGGPEVSYENNDFFEHHPYVDAILSGEGEEAIVYLCEELSRGERPEHQIICGTPWKAFEESGVYYETGEELCGRLLYYESSRGCPFRCAYCLSGETSGVRAKSAEKVAEDLLEFEKLPTASATVKFVDRTFNFDPSRTKAILKALLEPVYTKTYHFEICAELLDDETLEILKKYPAGKIQVEVGVQSTYGPALQSVKRPQKTDLVLKRLVQLKEMGNIHVHADLICGLPHESFERISQSFDEVYPCCHKLQLGFLKLLRGTPLRSEADRYGYSFLPDPPYTILKSDVLSYEEICRLEAIAETLERFNSGSFEAAVALLISLVNSPFSFYHALNKTFETMYPDLSLSQLSQRKAYELLYGFGLKLCRTQEEKQKLASALSFDFYLHEAGALPAFLPRDPEDNISDEASGEIKKQFAEEQKLLRYHSFFYPSLEVHRFLFLSGCTVIIDRKYHKWYAKTPDSKEFIVQTSLPNRGIL